jgi:hypothetical protein
MGQLNTCKLWLPLAGMMFWEQQLLEIQSVAKNGSPRACVLN